MSVALLGPTVAVPLYAAVIVCAPAVSDEVANAAWPASTGTTASTRSPSLKVIEPAGATCCGRAAERNPSGADPEPGAGVTVAVNVTD